MIGRRALAWTALAGAIALAGAASGCGSRALVLRPSARAFTPRDYRAVYDAWTRSTESYSVARFSDILRATATFEAWEFRWAYVVRYASDYALAPEERDAMLRTTLADAAETHRFFVTLAGSRVRETDLTSPETAWRALLVAPDGTYEPAVEVRKVVRPGAAERLYFPSVSPFRLAFRLSFPAVRADGSRTIPDGADRATLRFAGALGTVDLVWRFESELAAR